MKTKTIKIKIYSFDELSKEAQEKIINEYITEYFNITPYERSRKIADTLVYWRLLFGIWQK